MNDDELRSLIRAAIQRHLGSATPGPTPAVAPGAGQLPGVGDRVPMSFAQYRLERAADDTMCIIEPAVQCNHCGFCKCHGH